VTELGPRLVEWTDHALVTAQLLGVPRADIEEAVLSRHGQRKRNTGAADWLVVSRTGQRRELSGAYHEHRRCDCLGDEEPVSAF
jgi:hypothetical protein